MGLLDYIYRLKPQSGDTTPHNELDPAQTLSGGTISLQDLGGGNFAWRFSGSNSTGATDSYGYITQDSATGGGLTIAVRVRRHVEASGRHRFVSWSPSTTPNADRAIALRYETGDVMTAWEGTTNFVDPPNIPFDGTWRTYVCKLAANAFSGSDRLLLWRTGGGAGPGPDGQSANFNVPNGTLNTLVIECSDGTVDISDIVLWGEELSDADCDAVRDDIDAALGGGDPQVLTYLPRAILQAAGRASFY